MHTCLYVIECMYVCMYVYVYVHVYVYVCMYMWICTHIQCMFIYAYINTYRRDEPDACATRRTHTHTCVHPSIHFASFPHTFHIHTYVMCAHASTHSCTCICTTGEARVIEGAVSAYIPVRDHAYRSKRKWTGATPPRSPHPHSISLYSFSLRHRQ